MDLTKHCQICENRNYNPSIGTTCGLTSKKPNFDSSCKSISFGPSLEKSIIDVNTKFETILYSKKSAIFHSMVFGAIGIAIISGGYLLGEFLWDGGWISTTPLIIIVAGLSVFGFAIAPLNKYRQSIGVARNRKTELDSILSLYNIAYNFEIKFHKDIHDNLEVTSNLSFTRMYHR